MARFASALCIVFVLYNVPSSLSQDITASDLLSTVTNLLSNIDLSTSILDNGYADALNNIENVGVNFLGGMTDITSLYDNAVAAITINATQCIPVKNPVEIASGLAEQQVGDCLQGAMNSALTTYTAMSTTYNLVKNVATQAQNTIIGCLSNLLTLAACLACASERIQEFQLILPVSPETAFNDALTLASGCANPSITAAVQVVADDSLESMKQCAAEVPGVPTL